MQLIIMLVLMFAVRRCAGTGKPPARAGGCFTVLQIRYPTAAPSSQAWPVLSSTVTPKT